MFLNMGLQEGSRWLKPIHVLWICWQRHIIPSFHWGPPWADTLYMCQSRGLAERGQEEEEENEQH